MMKKPMMLATLLAAMNPFGGPTKPVQIRSDRRLLLIRKLLTRPKLVVSVELNAILITFNFSAAWWDLKPAPSRLWSLL